MIGFYNGYSEEIVKFFHVVNDIGVIYVAHDLYCVLCMFNIFGKFAVYKLAQEVIHINKCSKIA